MTNRTIAALEHTAREMEESTIARASLLMAMRWRDRNLQYNQDCIS